MSPSFSWAAPGQHLTALGMEAQQLTGLRSSVSGDLVTHLTSIQSRQCGPGSRSAEKSKMHLHGAVEGGHIAGLAPEDPGGGLLEEPGGGDADKDAGGDCQGGWHDRIIN